MVGFEILIIVSRAKRYEFIQAWEQFQRSGKTIPACRDQQLYENVKDLNSFLWVEYWEDTEQMEAHLHSNRFRTALGAIEVLGERNELRRMYFIRNEKGRD